MNGPGSRLKDIKARYAQQVEREPARANELGKERQGALLENSYAGILGKVIEPVIHPLGYDWKIGIALITSFAAREVLHGQECSKIRHLSRVKAR